MEKMNLNFEKLTVRYENGEGEKQSTIVVEPLEKGFSNVMAVPLRNTLLAAMPGAAVIGFRIDNVKTDMSIIEGSVSDTIELMLNLKKIKFVTEEPGVQILKFKANKAGRYTSNDIELIEGVELATPDVDLIDLDGSKEVEIEIFIKKGRGYTESIKHKEFVNKEEIVEGAIPVDGMFSPIVKVGYDIEEIRVGQNGDFERLILNVTTDGSMDALEAVNLAAKIVSFHFSFFEDMKEVVDDYELNKQEEIKEENLILEQSIGMLDLSVRSFNCLKREKIETIKQLCELDNMGLRSIEHLGKKSYEEILNKIESLGLSLKK